jgi:autoinducer 2-degrading protein
MYAVLVFLEAKPGYRDKLEPALFVNARNALDREPGCRRFDVLRDTVDGNGFLLFELYDNAAAHRAHLELPQYAEYRLLVDPWIESRRVLTYQLVSTPGKRDDG